MTKFNPPVTMMIYLGNGDKGKKLRENIRKKSGRSASAFVIDLLKKADPSLFKGVEDK